MPQCLSATETLPSVIHPLKEMCPKEEREVKYGDTVNDILTVRFIPVSFS